MKAHSQSTVLRLQLLIEMAPLAYLSVAPAITQVYFKEKVSQILWLNQRSYLAKGGGLQLWGKEGNTEGSFQSRMRGRIPEYSESKL